jgi:hypothetical protein
MVNDVIGHPPHSSVGTNVLGHYHLTNVLLPLLFKSPYKAEGASSYSPAGLSMDPNDGG